jgi:hypothetical protein
MKQINFSGPPLKTARRQHSCARIRTDSQSTKFSIIVAVGLSVNSLQLFSVELLDETSNEWIEGSNLNAEIYASQMVEDPNGGVILVGGTSDSIPFEDTLYRLPHGGAGAVWIKMDQKLKIGRYWHVAILIPDYMVECL